MGVAGRYSHPPAFLSGANVVCGSCGGGKAGIRWLTMFGEPDARRLSGDWNVYSPSKLLSPLTPRISLLQDPCPLGINLLTLYSLHSNLSRQSLHLLSALKTLPPSFAPHPPQSRLSHVPPFSPPFKDHHHVQSRAGDTRPNDFDEFFAGLDVADFNPSLCVPILSDADVECSRSHQSVS
ncbi:hypothetical protein PAAG_04854 [Paracoccidioides lutzii Pb01]|uniref:Uncharacterized protein n=1 Tax=Paracoccidioides lutzii (strain ATCC MYA-826 / Pb01) TaxID=502779 RepID=C1H1R8_PARBA|nr:hypothetical protein PAAG_04854 [Paracoccidioides lutzii Pb01]EEH33805.2 hypothetical protein PAAG_04854 [Paracoccidioides lutzii Pb01]